MPGSVTIRYPTIPQSCSRAPALQLDARISATALVLALLLAVPCHAQVQKPAAPPPQQPAAGIAPAPAPTPEAGVWLDDTGTGAIEISSCGANLCGQIVWLKNPLNKKGKPQADELNPNKALRNQPVCGLQVIGNLVQQKDGSWDKGWVYDPKVGEKFDLAINLKSADTLAVTGYLGIKLLSETFTWKRVPADPPLQRCSASAAEAARQPPGKPGSAKASR